MAVTILLTEDQERMMRDAKGLQLFEGTNEIQKCIITKHILG